MATKENAIAVLNLSDIHVDETQNVRQVYDEKEMKALISGIKSDGLLQPMVVRPSTVKDKVDKPFFLLAGYRRMRALKELKYETAGCVIKETDEKGGAITNMVENVNRSDLSSYELAIGCKRLRDVYGMTGAEISAKLRGGEGGVEIGKGKSKGNVDNLIRLLNNLHPDILKAWAERHEKTSTYNLLRIVALEDHDAQWAEWEVLLGIRPASTGNESAEGAASTGNESAEGAEEKEKGAKPKVRPMIDVLAAIRAVRYAGTLDTSAGGIKPELADAMVTTLEWCAGRRNTLVGLKKAHYDESAPKKAEKK